MVVGRLAPTPSGHLHLGNALAFGAAWLSVRGQDGRLLLRLEDIDRARSRSEVAEALREDLLWLGIDWDEEVAPQSARAYSAAGVPTFRCGCNRATRLAGVCRCRAEQAPRMEATLAPAEGHADSADDRGDSAGDRGDSAGDRGDSAGDRGDRGGSAIRFRTPEGLVSFTDRALGPQRIEAAGDPILISAAGEPAYPLAVVLDDARDGVTEVVRGADLLEATAVQVRLYEVLGRTPPSWLHVPVLLGPDGRKLSKSHGSTEIRALRARGWSRRRVWELLLPLLGLPPADLHEANLDPARIPPGPRTIDAEGRLVA